MAFDRDGSAQAIAASWGVSADLLEEADYDVETIDGNDGEVYGYLVRFDDETDPEILAELGLAPGELTRELSVNAFDEPDYTDYDYDRDLRIREGIEDRNPVEPDDDIFSVDEPMPDISDFDEEPDEEGFPELPRGQAYVVDKSGRVVVSDGRPVVVERPELSGAIGGSALNEHAVNGPAFAGASFAGNAFATNDTGTNGSRRAPGAMPTLDRNAIYQQELETRIERLEAALETYRANLPPRNHNRPPELVEPDPITAVDLKIVAEAVIELKVDAQGSTPDPAKLEANASLLRRVAGAIAAWCGRKVDAAVDSAIQWGVPIGLGWVATNPQEVQAALNAVAETASAWAAYLAALS